MKPHLGREVAASEYAHRLQELNKAVDKVQDCFHELGDRTSNASGTSHRSGEGWSASFRARAVRDRLTRTTSLALRKNRSASGYAPLAAASLGLLTYGGILARIPLRPNSATQLTRRSSALRPVPSASAQCRRVPKCRELTLPDRPRLALLPRLRS